VSAWAYWSALGGNVVLVPAAGFGQTPTAIRHVRTIATGGATRLSVMIDPAYYLPSTTYRVRFKARASVALGGTVSVSLRPQLTSTTGQVLTDISGQIGTTPTEIVTTITTSATAVSATPGFSVLWNVGTMNDTLDITDVIIEPLATAADQFFSYSTPGLVDSDNQLVARVVGAAGSVSQLQTRGSSFGPETDEALKERIDLLRRFMRRGAVTSGPTKLSEVQSGLFWAREVQFVISGGPHVVGMTKKLDVQPTIPAVVQDVPYNLIPYPSAEIAMSTEVTVARNFAANPSAETNANGWVPASSVATAGYLTSGRATDIQAAGVASAYSRLLPNDSTSVNAATATLELYQDVTLEAGSNRRISVNIWAAALILQGSSPGTAINSMQVIAQFFTSANASIGTASVGIATAAQYGGRVYSVTGIAIPANAAKVRIICRAGVTYSNVAQPTSDIRIYADALAVTVP
jgi:hypothetical protein